MVQLTIAQHWFRYLKQCWPHSLTHICRQGKMSRMERREFWPTNNSQTPFNVYYHHIWLMSPERLSVSFHPPLGCMFKSVSRLTAKKPSMVYIIGMLCWEHASDRSFKEHSEVVYYWPFLRGIHRSPMDSPHKRPIIQKSHPFHDVIMWSEFKQQPINILNVSFMSSINNAAEALWMSTVLLHQFGVLIKPC